MTYRLLIPLLVVSAACSSTAPVKTSSALTETLPPTEWSQVLDGSKLLTAENTPSLDLANPRDVALCTLAAGVARENGAPDLTDYWEDRVTAAADDARAGLALVQHTAAEWAALARAASEKPDGLRYIMLLNTVDAQCRAEVTT